MLHGSVGLFSFSYDWNSERSACLSSRDDSQSKACFLVWWSRHLNTTVIKRLKRTYGGAKWSIRSSITARMGATPVPGPTANNWYGCISEVWSSPYWVLFSANRLYRGSTAPWVTQDLLTQDGSIYQGARLPRMSYTLLSLVSSTLFDI